MIHLLDDDDVEESDSNDSLSDTEYPVNKATCTKAGNDRDLLVQRSLENNAPAMGEWERHTRVPPILINYCISLLIKGIKIQYMANSWLLGFCIFFHLKFV